MAARKPYKINAKLTNALRVRLHNLKIAIPEGWNLYVTDTVRGRTRHDQRSITVPVWAWTDGGLPGKEGYEVYYACHEIAHILAPSKRNDVHGPRFMKAFREICPEEYHHFELGYKPRLAAAAGIRQKEAK